MRARIASLFVCGFLFIGGTACQQNHEADVPSATPEPTAATVKAGYTRAANKKNKISSPAAAKTESLAAPSPESVAAAKAAASLIMPVKPGLRVSRVQIPGMYVALTFDDGPSSAYTPKVLDILQRHGAKGTFFVLGSNAKRCSSIVARAAAEGHEIGVHTWSHINMARSSMEKIDSEVSRTAEVIRSVTGKSPVVMRPPYGAVNARIVNHMYDRYGMRSILWDVDTQDWRRPGVSTVVSRAVNRAKPGSIILVHDIHASTLAAIEGIVTGLQARGYTLVTVSELLARAGVHAAPKSAAAPGAVEISAENIGTSAQSAENPAAETAQSPECPQPSAVLETETQSAEMTVPAAEDTDAQQTETLLIPAA